jgi:CheY-like chemotaxis protein
VLVIDDDPAIRDLVQRFLIREGSVSSPRAAAGRPAPGPGTARMITLDVLMPGLDGWAVLSALKGDPVLAEIPVIMLTMVDDRGLDYALGAAEYLTKPLDRERLLAAVRKHRRDLPVLVVDDDPVVRELLRRQLEAEGYRVSEAADGRAALARLREGVPSVILLDLMMPEMDGFELMEAMRREVGWASIPVVVLTAKDLTAEDRERLNGRVERVLQKGAYTADVLLADVRRLVDASLRRRRETP